MYSEHPTCSQFSAQSVREEGYAPWSSLQNVVLPVGAGPEPEPEPPLPLPEPEPTLFPSVRQIFQPDLVTEESEYHEMADPAVTATLLGPWLPSNLWLPIVSLSNPLSVLNAVELTSPDVPTLIEHV